KRPAAEGAEVIHEAGVDHALAILLRHRLRNDVQAAAGRKYIFDLGHVGHMEMIAMLDRRSLGIEEPGEPAQVRGFAAIFDQHRAGPWTNRRADARRAGDAKDFVVHVDGMRDIDEVFGAIGDAVADPIDEPYRLPARLVLPR